MVLSEGQKIAIAVGFVGFSGSGKNSLINLVQSRLEGLGLHVFQDHAGEVFRRKSRELGMPLHQFVQDTVPEELDALTDEQTKEYLMRTIGMTAWIEQYGAAVPIIGLLSGRMISFLADMAIHSRDIVPNSYLGVVIECPPWERARRIVRKMDGIPMNRSVPKKKIRAKQHELIQRDNEDLRRYQIKYGIRGWSDVLNDEINPVQVNSNWMSLDGEADMVIGAMVSRGMLPLAWDQRLCNTASDLTQV